MIAACPKVYSCVDWLRCGCIEWATFNRTREMPASAPIIIPRIIGGLGNQMFQYAAALALAERLGGRVFLDISAFGKDDLRQYELNKLNIPQNLADDLPLACTLREVPSRLMRSFRRGKGFFAGAYKEPHFQFDDRFFRISGSIIRLKGYFHSELYFAGCETMLREQFQPKEPLSAIAQCYRDQIRTAPKSVSLHVRRGDYVSNVGTASVHGSVRPDYWHRAIDLMNHIHGEDVTYFLFSDEPDYLASEFNDLRNAVVVRSEPSRPYEDMFLMRGCQHHIIANSSYSWWGAWLNDNPAKTVIAPAQWFTRAKLAKANTMDLYPEGWILLG